MDINKENQYAVILCGGSGTRLWPLSRQSKPKQFLQLNGNESLFQQTYKRLNRRINSKNIYIVTHQDHKFEAKKQLSCIDGANLSCILNEPQQRNTLPAISQAVFYITKKNPKAIVGIFPSDHAIENEDIFLNNWDSSEHFAEEGYLVLFGIKPSAPNIGYGYIEPGIKLENGLSSQVYAVKSFVEKPSISLAKKYIAKGYLWNSGIFVFKASIFISLLKDFQPLIYRLFSKYNDEDLTSLYSQLPSISMDYGIAEKASKIAMISMDIGWSDLGGWNAIFDLNKKDSSGNFNHGNVLNLQTKNSLIWAEKGSLVTFGLEGVIIIQTEDVTMIINKNDAENIKTLVEKVKENNLALTEIHKTVYRPWGYYTVLEESVNYKIKKIEVNPNAKLSLQLHKHRSEHWVVVSGIASIVNDNKIIELHSNESTFIPRNKLHRLANNSNEPLVIIEVQCGAYVGEDDIIRFDDDYGRGG